MQLLKKDKDLGFWNASVLKNSAAASRLSLTVSCESQQFPVLNGELWVCEVPRWCWNQRNLSSAAPCCCVEIKQAADEHVAVFVDTVRNNGTFSHIPSFTWCNGENDTPRQHTFFQDSDLGDAFRCTDWTIVANQKSYTTFVMMLKHTETTRQCYISFCSLPQLQTRTAHLRQSLKCPSNRQEKLLAEIHAFLKTFRTTEYPGFGWDRVNHHKKPGEGTAGTADPNCQTKGMLGYLLPCDVTLGMEGTGTRESRKTLRKGRTLI